jgi:hypothetical protein
MKKLSKIEEHSINGGLMIDQWCTGTTKKSPFKRHSYHVIGEGPTVEIAMADYNSGLSSHKRAMPEYNHSARYM